MTPLGRMADAVASQPVCEPMSANRFSGDSAPMSLITTIATVFGAVVGAAFLFAGGVVLPLWEQLETRVGKEGARR